MAGVAGTASMQRFIDPQILDLAGFEEFFPMLKATSESRFMEYLTVVRADKTIAVNINTNRSGEANWDPAGVVSSVLASSAQVIVHAPLTQDDYNAERPQQFFVGRYARSSGQDMKLSERPGLIRWSGTPIMSTNSSVKDPIGVLVAGYILSGKTDILEDAFAVSGDGMAAIKMINSVQKSITPIVELLVSSDQNVYYNLGVSESLQISFANSDADTTVTGVDGKSYHIRSSQMVHVSDGTVVVMIRGYPTKYVDDVYTESVVATLALFAGALIFDILSTAVGITAFVDPLQKLIIYIKLRHYELMDEVVGKLQLVKIFAVRLVIFGTISLCFLIAMFVTNNQTLQTAYSNQLAIRNEIRANAISFAQKQVQMTFGIITRTETLLFKNFVLNSTNGDYSAIQKVLNSSAARRQIETNTIVNSSCQIVASAYKFRSGEYFSPEGLCEDIVGNPRRICVLSTITAGQLAATGSPRYLDSRVNSSYFYPSILHPYASLENAAMRYCGVPIFGPGNSANTYADGVMIYGDNLNGKAYTPEWSMSPFDATNLDGYVGLFLYDKPSDSFKIVSSVMYTGSGNQGVSYDIINVDFTSILRTAKANDAVNPFVVSDEIVKINGVDMHVAAYRVHSTFEYVLNFKLVYPTSKYSPDLFLVRGSSAAAWKTLWGSQVAVMVCTIIMQIATAITISIVLYRPVAVLVAQLQAKGYHGGTRKAGPTPDVSARGKNSHNNHSTEAPSVLINTDRRYPSSDM
eukprot:TRINITY_DN11544_c0_g1_i3.p1 TRINITY_DN11544_c0_g1~~TRINITY_DN11544_c0_g1_i3.p1  ORF type:complete len:825 (+),score=161.23 TRINITY_DN11544_c0_g1_i3:232-2475(+)